MPVAKRPFRVEPSHDLRRWFVTDATGRLVGHLEYDRRRDRWTAFARQSCEPGLPGVFEMWTATPIGSFTGRYGQADAVTAIEKWMTTNSG